MKKIFHMKERCLKGKRRCLHVAGCWRTASYNLPDEVKKNHFPSFRFSILHNSCNTSEMIRENNLVAHSAVWKGLVAGMTLLDRKVLVLRSFSQFPTLLSTIKEVLWCLSRLTTQERNCVDEHHNTSLVSKSIQ